jgi:hypothetical protein
MEIIVVLLQLAITGDVMLGRLVNSVLVRVIMPLFGAILLMLFEMQTYR